MVAHVTYRKWILPLLVSAAVTLGSVSAAAEDEGPPPSDRPHATGHVLVKPAAGVGVADAVGQNATPIFGRWYHLPVPPGSEAEQMVETLKNNPRIEEASLDYLIQLDPTGVTALDGVSSTNDEFAQYQWHFPPIQVEEAWEETTGSGVVAAIVDTGISQDGEDLDCHTFVDPYNSITDVAGSTAAKDDNGHGTHVAGTVAQCTDNGVGVAGIAFDASLMPVKVLDANGQGSESTVAEGIEWARTHGADVINLSLGFDCGTDTWPECSSEIINEALEAAADSGIVIVAAAGNSGEGVVSHPANHPDVLAVGALDYESELTGYSNRGPNLDVVAPGGDNSADANNDGNVDGVLQETFTSVSGWNYYFFEGTSMASPHVTGAAVLLRSLVPTADRMDIHDALQATAMDLGAVGCDSTYGRGIVQIADALAYLTGPDTIPPSWPAEATLTVSEVGGTYATLSWPSACTDPTLDEIRVYVDGTHIQTLERDITSTRIEELVPATSYELSVRAADASGNVGSPLRAEIQTPDTLPPVWPAGSELKVLRYGESSLVVGWSQATDNVAVTGYHLRQAGTDGMTTTERQATVNDLESGSAYTFEVLAEDEAGNSSQAMTATLRTARAFADTAGSVFYGDILWLSGNDITRGCNPPQNDLYCPNDPVTRGQMAAFLTRALSLPSANTDTFTDDDNSVFQTDIEALANADITHGCNPPQNDLYCPNDPVTRGQMAAFLTRALSG